MSDHVKFQSDGAVARITIDNPSSRNGLTVESITALAEHIEHAGQDDEHRVIVLSGAGGHFCSGADLKAGAQLFGKSAEELHDYVRKGFHKAIEALITSPLPVLAVIRGACVGYGFDLALACDLRLASVESKMGQVFTRIALVPDGGSSFTLPRLVGLGRAMELMLLAETFDGQRAAEFNLVNRAVPDDQLDGLAAEWTERLAAGPPLAYRYGKRNLWAGAAGGSLSEALDREAQAQSVCLKSNDVMRGVQGFFTRENPTFKGD